MPSENIFMNQNCSLNPGAADGLKRSNETDHNGYSFTVSYLMDSCGLSPESAVSASKHVNFKSREKPDSVLRLLKDYGFTKEYVSKLVKKKPSVLVAKPERTLLPKLDFLSFIGVSSPDLPKIVSQNPILLFRSLQNHFIPCYDVLKSLYLADADKKIVKILKRTSWISMHSVRTNVVENVSILRRHGVPQSIISEFITCFPSVMFKKADTFDEHVKKVKEMGFNPLTTTFVLALKAVSTMSKSKWESKLMIYKRCGWSEDEILLAFKKHPICLTLSEKKITSTLDFLVNKMGWQPSAIARVPTVLSYSLVKRIIPRCSVTRVLRLNGLINDEISLPSVVISPEKYFLETYVTNYMDQVSQLLNSFQGKINMQELGFGFEQTSHSHLFSM